jgi:hypothetical protein
MKTALCIALLVAGCGKADKTKPAPAPEPAKGSQTAPAPEADAATPSPAAGGDCDARAAKLGARMKELAAATPGFAPILKDLNAPEAAAGKPFDERGFVVALAKDGTMYSENEKLPDLKTAEAYLDAMNKSALEQHVMGGGSTKDAKFAIYYWVDRDVSAGKLADLVAAADKAGNHWTHRILVAGKTALPAAELPAEVGAIAAKVPASPPDSIKYVVDQIKAAIGSCSDLITPLGTASLEGVPGKISDKLIAEVPIGLTKCGCDKVKVDLLEWGIGVWFGSSAPPLAWVDMPALKKGDKQPISKLVK